MQPTTHQLRLLKLALEAVIDAVKAAGPMGAPGGVIYAAMMAQGASLSQYQSIMGALVSVGKLRRQGDLYFIAEQKEAA